MASAFYSAVIKRNAKLVAQVMMAGFVHGVLNTDNINIAGELFDYGPYRFLPYYDPEFTAAYFDQQGLYCFGRQPASFVWALHQLGLSLKQAFPQLDVNKHLEEFSGHFNENIQELFLKRLNVKPKSKEENSSLLSSFFQMVTETEVHFEQAFFDFHSKHALSTAAKAKYEKTGNVFLQNLDKFDVLDNEKANHSYFKSDSPVMLLIDEIEALWKPIAESDDWSSYNKKLQAIRSFRGIY
jgi:uncharacterized protein YdiU (UPF0061 family)